MASPFQLARRIAPSSCAVAPSFHLPFSSFPFLCDVSPLCFDPSPCFFLPVSELDSPCVLIRSMSNWGKTHLVCLVKTRISMLGKLHLCGTFYCCSGHGIVRAGKPERNRVPYCGSRFEEQLPGCRSASPRHKTWKSDASQMYAVCGGGRKGQENQSRSRVREPGSSRWDPH